MSEGAGYSRPKVGEMLIVSIVYSTGQLIGTVVLAEAQDLIPCGEKIDHGCLKRLLYFLLWQIS